MERPNSDVSENSRFFGSISSSVPFKNLLHKSKQKSLPRSRLKFRHDVENRAPINSNIQINDPPISASISFSKKSTVKSKLNHCKENLSSTFQEQAPETPDPPVKVIVRIKPTKGLGIGESSVTNVTGDSVSIGDRRYNFDAVLDSKSTQEDIYELVGAPLVKDALSGYNTSIVAYGQTGTGKTYTMWGPPSAMVESPSVSGPQGIVPRIFQNLFSKIQKEQENSDGKHINYQCRCSFLEVYDEKICDLLEQKHRNLEIKNDVKNGFHVENLTEEYVTSYEDVTQILIKGLSNRKVGATSINSKSSRSHIMFTCVIESWCKESSSKCFGSSKTSRICLIDLAGFSRNILDDATRQNVKEEKYIKKSLSQLGHLVNILVEQSESGQLENNPYRSSRLTHLLKESFGGNAKLSVVCAISPDYRYSGETLSTLRFGLKAKLMKNEPVINEITEDDVNDLTDQIRELKEELLRAKSNTCNSLNRDHGYFSGGNVRESLNKLRLSLNRSLILPSIDNDSEEDLCINEEDVRELRLHVDSICGSHEENLKEESETGENTLLYSAEGCEADLTCEHYLSCTEESESEEIISGKRQLDRDLPHTIDAASVDEPEKNSKSSTGLSISECLPSTFLEDPVLSESPKIKNSPRKSVVFLTDPANTYQDNAVHASNNLQMLHQSDLPADHIRSSLGSSRVFQGPTESLAASLHRGLQIIDYHQRCSASTRSSVSFSFGHLALKPCLSADKANASIQTSLEKQQFSDSPSANFVCVKCQGRENDTLTEVDDGVKAKEMVADGLEIQQTKAVEKELAVAIQKEKELSAICKEQADKIEHLNQLLEKYKCNSFNSSGTKNQPQPIKEDVKEDCHPKNRNNRLLTFGDEDGDHELEVTKETWEVKEVQEESSCNINKSINLEEKETLLKEIGSLRNKLHSDKDSSIGRSTEKLRSSLLSQSIQLRKSCAFTQSNSKEEFEKERQKWMEMESEWISLTDELRIEIEANRQRAEQVEMELRLEKKCTEELDDVLKRSVQGHARMIEHYAELQDKYNDIVVKHRAMMEGVAEVKRAVEKAGAKGRHGSRLAKSLAAELSALRVEREKERDMLRKENRSLKIQLKDTAEAVHAAGEVLVRLKEAEETASVAEGKNAEMQEENDKLKKQIEKLKRKHKMEMITMKQYLAESRLPESALRPLYREDSDVSHHETSTVFDDDQSWRAEFGAIYQDHDY